MAELTPLINGVRHSWGEVKIIILGRTVTGISAISYDDKQDKKNHYGAGNMPSHRGKGRYEASAKVTLYDYEVDAIQRSLGVGKRLQEISSFDVVVAFAGEDDIIVTHVIRNCEFMDNKRDLKEGDTTFTVELGLLPSHIEWS